MRVSIVTEPLHGNCGGVLQNYALQQILKGWGHSPITLNYMPSLSVGRYILYVCKALLCIPFPSLRHSIKPYKRYLSRPPLVDAFIRNNITLTEVIPRYTERILKKVHTEAIVVGSDQVWRYAYNKRSLEDMFLAFAKNYNCLKTTYAASFGLTTLDYPPRSEKRIKKLIKQFQAISVREESGVSLCRNKFGVGAVTVLDPTLLLQPSVYEQFCVSPESGSSPYLAAYVLDMSKEKSEYIKAVAQAKGLSIQLLRISNGDFSIEKWLSIIRFADFVITDSYHGSIFSILFERQFQTIINRKRGSDRFITLFNKLDIQDRLLESTNLTFCSNTVIDYSRVSRLLKSLREESLLYLQSSLSI